MTDQLYPPIYLEYSRGPKLTFTNSLPVRLKSIQSKDTHLLKTRIGRYDTISEIVLLKNFTTEKIEDIQAEINEFNENDNNDISMINSRALRNALDVAFFYYDLFQDKESTNIFKTPIALSEPKIKTGPDRPFIKDIQEHLERLDKKPIHSIRIDANQSFSHQEFQLFIKGLNGLNADIKNNIEYIEEPLQQADLDFLNLYNDENLSFAIDESLELIWDDTKKRDLLKQFQYLIIKPAMTPLHVLRNIKSKYPHLKFVLSCLYEGPWNLKYFWKIHQELEIETLSGLYPLHNISENQKYISIKNGNQLTLSH